MAFSSKLEYKNIGKQTMRMEKSRGDGAMSTTNHKLMGAHNEKREQGSKMGDRIGKAFRKVEHEPVQTRHKGKPSGCME